MADCSRALKNKGLVLCGNALNQAFPQSTASSRTHDLEIRRICQCLGLFSHARVDASTFRSSMHSTKPLRWIQARKHSNDGNGGVDDGVQGNKSCQDLKPCSLQSVRCKEIHDLSYLFIEVVVAEALLAEELLAEALLAEVTFSEYVTCFQVASLPKAISNKHLTKIACMYNS